VRRLYAILIYTTLALGIATVWAVGENLQAQALLERARRAAAVPYQPMELEALRLAAAADDAPARHDTPVTRPVVEPTAIRRAVQVDTGTLVP
jgi:hypothetical protein